jgi:SSS family solute:Na+ symporter
MQTLDLIIIFGYLIGVTLFGMWFPRNRKRPKIILSATAACRGGRLPASIVATETSTITFISVPGIAFAKGGNFQFLQLVFGYMLGRIVISLLFIPMYFRGELLTVYQLLGERFGLKVKMLASALVRRDAKYRRRHSAAFDGDCSGGRLRRFSAERDPNT